MTFKNSLFSAVFLSFLSACGNGQPSDIDLKDDRQGERFVKMLDDRRYDELIELLSPHMAENPRWAVLVGQAQLGRASFEPILVSKRIVENQTGTPSNLDALIPNCSTAALSSFSKIEVPCVLKRLFQNLPSPDHPSLIEGLRTLKATYPVAESSPKNMNFLIGLVELSMAVSRLGQLLLYYDALDLASITDGNIQSLYDQSHRTALHADQSFYRARYAGKSISSALTGLKQFEIMDFSGKSGSYRPGSGFPELIEIADPTNRTLEIKLLRTMLIQNLDRVVESFKNR